MDRITGSAVADLGDGKRGFQDQILATGEGSQEGTVVTALWLNAVQEELLKVIEEAGIPPDDGDLTQLSQAIRDTMSAGALIGVQKFEASGTYTPSSNTRFIIVEAVGGGGSGAGALSSVAGLARAGGGGSGGSYGKWRVDAVPPSETVVVGAGGAGVTGNVAGNDGGASFFGELTAPGGLGSGEALSVDVAVTARSSSAGFTPAGASGAGLLLSIAGQEAHDGNCFAGFPLAGNGGGSALGCGGYQAAPNSDGHAGTGYGAGSSGASAIENPTSWASLDGQDGLVVVWEYA